MKEARPWLAHLLLKRCISKSSTTPRLRGTVGKAGAGAGGAVGAAAVGAAAGAAACLQSRVERGDVGTSGVTGGCITNPTAANTRRIKRGLTPRSAAKLQCRRRQQRRRCRPPGAAPGRRRQLPALSWPPVLRGAHRVGWRRGLQEACGVAAVGRAPGGARRCLAPPPCTAWLYDCCATVSRALGSVVLRLAVCEQPLALVSQWHCTRVSSKPKWNDRRHAWAGSIMASPGCMPAAAGAACCGQAR